MPTPECWEELGKLRAEVDIYSKQFSIDTLRIQTLESRINELEHDRIRVKTLGGLAAFLLTGIGVFFADPIRKVLMSFFH